MTAGKDVRPHLKVLLDLINDATEGQGPTIRACIRSTAQAHADEVARALAPAPRQTRRKKSSQGTQSSG